MECKPNASESNRAASPFALAAKRSGRRLLSDKRAASIVEFALVTPILLLLLGGAIDFGVLVRTKMQLSSSVSAAANYAINNAALVELDGCADAGPEPRHTDGFLQWNELDGTSWANSSATVNFGPSVDNQRRNDNPTWRNRGAASNFYCPTSSGRVRELEPVHPFPAARMASMAANMSCFRRAETTTPMIIAHQSDSTCPKSQAAPLP